jgi:hypothetical protein
MSEQPDLNGQSHKLKPDRFSAITAWAWNVWRNKETLQAFANLATTITAFLTLAALFWTITESSSRETKEEVRNVQKPLIYSIIRDRGSSTFEEIRTVYLRKAAEAKLPREAITDTELNRVILALMETHVIVRDPTGRYLPTITSTLQDQAVSNLLKEVKEREQAMVVRSRIISIVEAESGKYTIETLYQKLKQEGITVSFEMVANLVSDLRSQRVVNKDEQKFLHDTYDAQ